MEQGPSRKAIYPFAPVAAMRPLLSLAFIAALVLAGCVSPLQQAGVRDALPEGLTDVQTRRELPFDLTGEYSRTLIDGAFGILDPLSVFVDLQLPVTELGSAVDGSAKVHLGLWLPDVPEGTKVPVIADIGPYYDDGDLPATEPALRLGKFLIENFVPHGYAVAQVSVLGTGESTHCMDLMGPAEQAGVDAAVTWLGTQEWSNGNVGLIGRSYDGSTPWQAAMFGNQHLKTIVPISGLIGMHELMWRNGSAEFRGPIMHNVVYGTFGVDSVKGSPFGILGGDLPTLRPEEAPEDAYNLCKGYLEGPAQGAFAVATGSDMTPYWQQRSFLPAALENYKGSVYFIHGLQDWNVDPHMIAPAYQQLQAARIETKGLFGQWAHMYPDRAAEHKNLNEGRGKEAIATMTRMDWAQDLLEWFDHYLKGTGPKPPLHVEIQDNLGAWRIEETFPPADATWLELALGDAERTEGSDLVSLVHEQVWRFAPLSTEADVRVSGLPQFHVAVTPNGPGGQLYVSMHDAETGLHLGHAVMDLRYHDGGRAMLPVAPGQPIVARMEFEPLDIVLPAGHGIELRIAATGEDYLPSTVSAPVRIDASATLLRLPTIERAENVFFVPPLPTEVKGDTPDF